MDFEDVLTLIKDNRIERVDLRGVDLMGRLRRLTLPVSEMTPDLFRRGVGADAFNYGLGDVERSDVVLVPDPSTARIDPTRELPTVTMIADLAHADGELLPAAPRSVARKAQGLLAQEGLADEARLGVELEFYVFDSLHVDDGPLSQAFSILPIEGDACLSLDALPSARTAYHAGGTEDRGLDLRDEVTGILETWGVPVRYHHHEAGSLGHNEIELGFGDLLEAADWTVLIKDLVARLASERGMVACFLPKPLHGQPGNGLHFHQYLVRAGVNLCADGDGLSQLALRWIGGLLTHGRALSAWVTPSTNSYRRLVPGHEAPVHLAFGHANRTAAVRVPGYAKGSGTMRFEYRVPDPTCNPYLAFAACLMAGLDGVRRDIDPVAKGWGPWDENLYQLSGRKADRIHMLPRDLHEAAEALRSDHAFLTYGDVFPQALVDAWVRSRIDEARAVAARPHPHEFRLYGGW